MHLKKITIQAAQLEELKKFYHFQFSLPISEAANSFFIIQIGESLLRIEEATTADPFYHFAINIPANKIDEAREWLKKNQVELLWMEDYQSEIADFVNWHAKSVYFFDPAGNVVELIARLDLNNSSDEPFSSKQFHSISEIGLVFPEDQIDKQVNEIMKQCKLEYFLKQRPMKQFKVLGDDEGLFIVVTEHRNWYPTTRPSGIFPLEILMENDGVTQVLRYD